MQVDMALLDGNFRVAAALRLLPLLTQDSVVIIHDFFERGTVSTITINF
jgi:hypothetical protein